MFQIVIQKTIDSTIAFQQTACVSTLTEAERLAVAYAEKHFKDIPIVLVHRGNLFYDIYKVEGILGKIRIKSVGD